jgi:hypothetical protein
VITVSVDHARKTVIARMSGFLSTEEVKAFARKEEEAVESMDLGSGQFYLLIDTSEAIIQPQDVVAAFQHLVQNAVYKAARIAVARHGSLTKMQTERILRVRGDTAVFETLAEAEEWLFSKPLSTDVDKPRSRAD